MTFEEAMSFVEIQHEFPVNKEDFHKGRAAEIFRQTGLIDALRAVPTVVVAGTCGKASTARFLAECASSLLELVGDPRPIGLATKPPLHETLDGNRERYQLLRAGFSEWIAPTDFVGLVERLPSELPKRTAPYDLRSWLVGRYFCDQKVALGIVEANIGFRDDPVSLYPQPVAVMLTPVGTDHVALLRSDGAPSSYLALGDCAGPLWHKFAAIPPGGYLVSGLQRPDVATIVEAYPGELSLGGRDFQARVLAQSLLGTRAILEFKAMDPVEVELQCLGRHQAENAAQAASCLAGLVERGVLSGTKDEVRQAIRTGVARTVHPGRLQIVAEQPRVLLSVGMGEVKLQAVVDTLEEVAQDDDRIAVILAIEDRLIPGHELPTWLDVSLRRFLSSSAVSTLFLTAMPGDAPKELLEAWANERNPQEKPVAITAPEEVLDRACSGSNVVVLVGQSLAELRV